MRCIGFLRIKEANQYESHSMVSRHSRLDSGNKGKGTGVLFAFQNIRIKIWKGPRIDANA